MHLLNPFVCGTFNNEYDEACVTSPSSSPRKCKRKDSSKNNNPYSSRGLDKFSELLADLDEKRQRIYSQMNPHDISFVRFVYSNTDDIVPVVVKVKNNSKDQKQHNKSQEFKVGRARRTTTMTHNNTAANNTSESMDKHSSTTIDQEKVANKRKFCLDMFKPSFYLPMVMMLILLLLLVFGRSVTTLCICILWYVISRLKGSSDGDNSSNNSLNMGNLMKKKDCVKGVSEKKIVSNDLGIKKKDYVRWWSEKKMVVSEEKVKKKDYVRGWSEKKMASDVLLNFPRSSADDSEASKNKVEAQHSHKKTW